MGRGFLGRTSYLYANGGRRRVIAKAFGSFREIHHKTPPHTASVHDDGCVDICIRVQASGNRSMTEGKGNEAFSDVTCPQECKSTRPSEKNKSALAHLLMYFT